jgi:hypothetical protein
MYLLFMFSFYLFLGCYSLKERIIIIISRKVCVFIPRVDVTFNRDVCLLWTCVPVNVFGRTEVCE